VKSSTVHILASAAAIIGALLTMASDADAKPKHDGRLVEKDWPIVYRTDVARADGAKGTCPVRISTDGKEWPRPQTNYVWVGLDANCEASGLAVHENVTRNNADPNQR
jgi:hypothetical protein